MHHIALPEALAAPGVLKSRLGLLRLQHVCSHTPRPPLPLPSLLLVWVVYLQRNALWSPSHGAVISQVQATALLPHIIAIDSVPI